MRVQLTCYGKTYAEHVVDLDEAKRIAEEHIRDCPHGAMPWATHIRWHEVDYRPGLERRAWVSAAKREWLDHHIVDADATASRTTDS